MESRKTSFTQLLVKSLNSIDASRTCHSFSCYRGGSFIGQWARSEDALRLSMTWCLLKVPINLLGATQDMSIRKIAIKSYFRKIDKVSLSQNPPQKVAFLACLYLETSQKATDLSKAGLAKNKCCLQLAPQPSGQRHLRASRSADGRELMPFQLSKSNQRSTNQRTQKEKCRMPKPNS